ncbi:MAG: GNAT family N-acetyltransferase [Bacilli bacterium]|nr:GNAT family N-acetyltransferase [Bacilli bacterium]MBR3049758.1 GNAT family N-acetyltransferase [Bacilli bacterium]
MKLRELKEKDVNGMLEWMHSKKTKDIFIKDFNSLTKEQVLDFINNSSKLDNELHYACVDDNDNYLGTVSLKNINKKTKDTEIAISFIEKAHGSGAAKYAISEIISIAFNKLNLERVYLNVLETNKRAIAFYNKVGFKQDKYKEKIRKDNKDIDLLYFSIVKREFNNE